MGWHLYVVAGLFLVIALLIRRSGRRYSLRARDIMGANVHVGDTVGAAEQKPDRVAWAIGIVGVLIAAAQLGYSMIHDLLAE